MSYIVQIVCGHTLSHVDTTSLLNSLSLNTKPEEKVIVIMGNGPSLKDVDFELLKKVDTFGMNGAYRKYEKLNFYPTYFGCFDTVVCEQSAPGYSKLVHNSPIKKFFFIKPDYFSKETREHPKFQKLNFNGIYDGTKESTFEYFMDIGCTGGNCTQIAIMLGYTKIILIGCEANYVDYIQGAKVTNDNCLVIEKLPDKNPNYWCDDYQQTGDRYNVPKAHIYHIPAWEKLSVLAKKKNVKIVNCSSISKIPYFQKTNIMDELKPYISS